MFKDRYTSLENIRLHEVSGGGVAQLIRGRASDRKVAGLIPVLDSTSLCPWKRHLTLIS